VVGGNSLLAISTKTTSQEDLAYFNDDEPFVEDRKWLNQECRVIIVASFQQYWEDVSLRKTVVG
jgi:hypothetical protein